MFDIYFEEAYGKSCEFIDKGRCDRFVYQDANGRISNMYIVKDIDISLGDEKLYDIVTPYGYGGPIIEEVKGDKKALVKAYDKAFTEYCRKNNIVSEFVRFHPLLKNYQDFDGVYETDFLRHTVATVIKGKEDAFQEEFSKSTRKQVRRSLREDLDWKIRKSPDDLDEFIEIYYDTMDRNDAEDFYYFEREYFDYLLDHLKEYILNINIYKDGVCIASGLYFVYKNFLHAHLSGTRHEYLKYSPAYLLKYLTTRWGEENGIDYSHYGGGTTNDPDDSLLRFKKKFTDGEGILDFYIGKKIFDKEIYDKLVDISGNKDKEKDFFPAYRK